MNSDDIPPMPALEEYSFALDIDIGPPFGENTVSRISIPIPDGELLYHLRANEHDHFRSDIRLVLTFFCYNERQANVYDDAVVAKTRSEDGKQGQKRSSSFISEDESQSCASKSKEAAYFSLVDKATAEGRIDTKKADRLRACLNSDDTIHSLLTELIPDKRKGKGFYKCRVCEVPRKDHICPYCPVCSTPEKKFLKNDNHVCVNCVKCFDEGKKKKKLIQFLKQECPCKSKERKI